MREVQGLRGNDIPAILIIQDSDLEKTGLSLCILIRTVPVMLVPSSFRLTFEDHAP